MAQKLNISEDFLKQEPQKPRLAVVEDCMWRFLQIAAALFWAAATVGAAEKEVLRVEYEYYQEGERPQLWVEHFFVDGGGALSSTEKVIRSGFPDEASTTIRTTFRWEGATMAWESPVDSGSISGAGGHYTIVHRGSSEDREVSETSERFWWRSASTVGVWSPAAGYDRRLLSDPEAGPPAFEGISTLGSRVTFWSHGTESYRILFDRTPTRLEGRIYAPAENAPVMYECGRILFTGGGLWNASMEVRAKVFLYLDGLEWLQGWQPFVLSSNYLH